MKKSIIIFITFLTVITCSSFTIDETIIEDNNKEFDIDNIPSYLKTYAAEEYSMCGQGSVKSYMDYKLITSPSSKQFRFINEYMYVDEETGFLYDADGFVGAALGSHFGQIGDRFYFTLENGVTLPIVKIESKADRDTDSSNCYNPYDNSVIEFVVDTQIANNYFGQFGNNLVLSGNYGNYAAYKGNIVKVEKVTETKLNNEIIYSKNEDKNNDLNIFYYGSGY